MRFSSTCLRKRRNDSPSRTLPKALLSPTTSQTSVWPKGRTRSPPKGRARTKNRSNLFSGAYVTSTVEKGRGRSRAVKRAESPTETTWPTPLLRGKSVQGAPRRTFGHQVGGEQADGLPKLPYQFEPQEVPRATEPLRGPASNPQQGPKSRPPHHGGFKLGAWAIPSMPDSEFL